MMKMMQQTRSIQVKPKWKEEMTISGAKDEEFGKNEIENRIINTKASPRRTEVILFGRFMWFLSVDSFVKSSGSVSHVMSRMTIYLSHKTHQSQFCSRF